MSIGKRLRAAIKHKALTLSEFSEKSKVPYRTLHRYLTDSRTPGGESLIKLNATLGISTDWLLTGNGQMLLNEKPEINESPKWFTNWWQHADDDHRTWLKIQLTQTPPVTK